MPHGQDWKTDFPKGTEEMWDIMAKSLLLRFGGSAHLTTSEMKQAAQTPCFIKISETGDLLFEAEDLSQN